MIAITDFFSLLGAPLANARWSWGSARASDGAVFLRVWQDRIAVHGGQRTVMISHNAKYVDSPEALGYKERRDHIAKVRAGARCYLVMCLAKDVAAMPRKIKSFDRQSVFLGGDLVEADGDTWIVLADRLKVSEVAKRKTD